MTRILGIDPGDTTGAMLIEVDPKNRKPPFPHLRMENVPLTNFFEWVDYLDSEVWRADIWVIEDFIARPSFSQGVFQELPTAKQIGALLYRAHLLGVRVVLQQPSIKPTGYKLMNVKYIKGAKGRHMLDAGSHAVYFAVNGVPAGTSMKPVIRRLSA